ncbi:MAG: nucleoside hydrolase [Bacteroidota bacterium]
MRAFTKIIVLYAGYSMFSAGTPVSGQDNGNPTSLIIDADTANEIDDLYALARALREPKFKVLGITSAQFHTSPLASKNTVQESQQLNEKIFQLMQIQDIPLPLGSNIPLVDRSTPSISEASNFIIAQAQKFKERNPPDIVILGSCTNVASAILQDPTIIPKIRVHYVGFWHDPVHNTFNKEEFNSRNDPIAVDVLLNTKELDFNVMTATTSQHLIFDKAEVDLHLKGKGGIADYLVNRWETYYRWWTKEDPEKRQWIMWDLALIEALARPELAQKKYFRTPEENTPRTISVYTKINVEQMIEDFWQSLKKI